VGKQGLYIGTSGWSYKHWQDIFYPNEIRPEKYLEFYTSRFECVELNSSFYNLPRVTTVSGWMRRTPGNFRFCPKISRLITHHLRLTNIVEPLRRFFDVFAAMREKMGPVLIQLPPGLTYDRAMILGFLGLLTRQYIDYRYAVEIRHRSWMNEEFVGLLSDYNISLVIADSGTRYPYTETITTDFVYLRFHGRNQLYASDYSEEVLKTYADKIAAWLRDGKEVWAFFNNDYHGYAVKNAFKLRELI
jgi:uncharacterized protein YecE (DUF72 family)